VPTPRHASHAAIDPVETVTPPISTQRQRPWGRWNAGILLVNKNYRWARARAERLVLHFFILRLIGFRRGAGVIWFGWNLNRLQWGDKMRKQLLLVAVEMTINEGQLENFKKLASEMTALCESEPGTLGYEWFFSADRKHCRLQESYVDGDAMLAHMGGPVIRELVPKLGAFCKTGRLEIYGDPGPKVAEIASGIGAQIFTYWNGLSR
jgi:quinol monooxygenase YgiN